MFTALMIIFFLIALGIGGWLLRGYLTGEGTGATLLGNARDKRTGVIEQTSVDRRRKLVLIRRDGTEHLIMTGGPVDVVIETGIAPIHRPVYERVGPSSSAPTLAASSPEIERQAPGFARVRQTASVQGE